MSGGFDPPSSPGSNPPPPAYAAPVPPQYPPDSRTTASMVLGIAGLVLLVTSTGLLAPISIPCSILGWIFGRGRAGNAKVGRICGMIGVGLGIFALLFWGAVLAAALSKN